MIIADAEYHDFVFELRQQAKKQQWQDVEKMLDGHPHIALAVDQFTTDTICAATESRRFGIIKTMFDRGFKAETPQIWCRIFVRWIQSPHRSSDIAEGMDFFMSLPGEGKKEALYLSAVHFAEHGLAYALAILEKRGVDIVQNGAPLQAALCSGRKLTIQKLIEAGDTPHRREFAFLLRTTQGKEKIRYAAALAQAVGIYAARNEDAAEQAATACLDSSVADLGAIRLLLACRAHKLMLDILAAAREPLSPQALIEEDGQRVSFLSTFVVIALNDPEAQRAILRSPAWVKHRVAFTFFAKELMAQPDLGADMYAEVESAYSLLLRRTVHARTKPFSFGPKP